MTGIEEVAAIAAILGAAATAATSINSAVSGGGSKPPKVPGAGVPGVDPAKLLAATNANAAGKGLGGASPQFLQNLQSEALNNIAGGAPGL